MYLRTPKRYSRIGQRRDSRRVMTGCGLRLVLVLVLVGLTVTLVWAYNNYGDNLRQYSPLIETSVAQVIGNGGSMLNTAIASTPTPTATPDPTILTRAQSAWDRGSIEEATNLYAELTRLYPNDIVVHYRYTLGLMSNGRLSEALSASYALVNADPFSSDAWALHAMMLEWNGRSAEAISASLRAIELNEDNARAYAFLAEAYLSVEQYERAQATINQALELDPDSFEAYRVEGLIIEVTLFDWDAAREAYLTAYELARHIPYPALDLARLDVLVGDPERAVELLNQLIELNPNSTEARLWLGVAYFRGRNDPSQAAAEFAACLDVDADNIDCNYWMGRMQLRLEDTERAIDYTQRAINLGSTDPYHYWWAGQALISNGRCGEALPVLQEGYRLARVAEQENIYDDYDALLLECGSVNPFAPTSTPVVEPTAEAGS